MRSKVNLLKRTNIEIDIEKLKKAKKITQLKTIKQVVDHALDRLVSTSETLEKIWNLRGKIHFDEKYDYKSQR